jgi:hypothetical protein
LKLRVERKAGEMLGRLERDQGGSGKFGSSNDGQTSEYAKVLEDTDTSRQDASRWQAENKISEEKFERKRRH